MGWRGTFGVLALVVLAGCGGGDEGVEAAPTDGADAFDRWEYVAMNGEPVTVLNDGGETSFSELPDGRLVPSPIAMVDELVESGDCAGVEREAEFWESSERLATSSEGATRISAYQRYARDKLDAMGC